jgi:Tfp pilus assembly protein FimT
MGQVNFFVKFNNGVTMIEFSLVLVVAILAFIAMQPMIKRSTQGRLRSSADSIGEQFSPRWTTIDETYATYSSTEENVTGGNLTRTTNRGIVSFVDRETSPIKQESPELRN